MASQRKGGLGRGLGALLPETEPSVVKEAAQMAAIISIKANPHQPRTDFSEEELTELADSIKEHGVIQPLIVTQEDDGTYTLIAGERRLRAAQLAGLTMVPVIVRQATDQEMLELALIENVQRADLSPLETAEAYKNLEDAFGMTHEEISKRVGKNRVSVTNTLRLLKLPENIKDALASRKITEGHARAILSIENPDAQTSIMNTIISKNLSVRQTEDLIRRINGELVKTKKTKREVTPEIKLLEDDLMKSLGTKVSVRPLKNGGTIQIHYYSDEELQTLVNRLNE